MVVKELSESGEFSHSACVSSHSSQSTANLQITVDQALVAQVDLLKAENHRLKSQLAQARQAPFRIECMADNDSLVSLYTGFPPMTFYSLSSLFLGLLSTSCDTGDAEQERVQDAE